MTEIPEDLRGHDPEEDYPDGMIWQYASELAYRRGCRPDNDCWSDCRESAADDLRDVL
jgi:hypothetical protein